MLLSPAHAVNFSQPCLHLSCEGFPNFFIYYTLPQLELSKFNYESEQAIMTPHVQPLSAEHLYKKKASYDQQGPNKFISLDLWHVSGHEQSPETQP